MADESVPPQGQKINSIVTADPKMVHEMTRAAAAMETANAIISEQRISDATAWWYAFSGQLDLGRQIEEAAATADAALSIYKARFPDPAS